MKRFIPLMGLAVMLIAGISGCGETRSPEDEKLLKEAFGFHEETLESLETAERALGMANTTASRLDSLLALSGISGPVDSIQQVLTSARTQLESLQADLEEVEGNIAEVPGFEHEHHHDHDHGHEHHHHGGNSLEGLPANEVLDIQKAQFEAVTGIAKQGMAETKELNSLIQLVLAANK
ncbi:hypothetical protein [Pontibacter sp. G13]|uniref:hypothetical protein n=1 Tax=Pontibacter sp. G13 TaxID=3074898 RepID=UPI0028896F22|nr:hypothetical protein [Pontibacter sp. G13]WNJ19408.1 hypothetical protein RJD25_02855 [Pontibacter sp. G13]